MKFKVKKYLSSLIISSQLCASLFGFGATPVMASELTSSFSPAYSTVLNGWEVADLSGFTDPIKTPEQLLVESLLGSGVSVSNIKFTGTSTSAGMFRTTENIIGFQEGVILSSGSVHNVVGPNNDDAITADNGLPGDPNLDTLIPGYTTYDATVLEFDFVPNNDHISFQYVFASEEYNEWVNSAYNDVFGFFLNGENVAKLPNSDIVVSINNVNNGNPVGTSTSNSLYYVNNDLSDGGGTINTQMDGQTVVLSVYTPVKAGETNHIKLAVADAGDHILDSNVYIKAGSFTDTPNTAPVAKDDFVVTEQSTPVVVDILSNDSDQDSDPLMVTGVTQGSNGSVVMNENGNSVIYTPDSGFVGTDVFSYTINDGKGGVSTATVTVDVKPVNQQLKGQMTGGGSIFTEDETRVTHGFTISSDITNNSNNLQINWGKNNKFHLTSLTEAVLVKDSSITTGTPSDSFNTFKGKAAGIYNGNEGYTVEFVFTDAGEPGSKDFASIIIKDSDGNEVLKASGNLDRGNQQAHAE